MTTGRAIRATGLYDFDCAPVIERRRSDDSPLELTFRMSPRLRRYVGDSAIVRFLSNRNAEPLSFDLTADERRKGELARLILDGVLEIDGGERFVTGPAAWELLFASKNGAPICPPSNCPSAALSITALRLASAKNTLNPAELQSWLYLFNREPPSPGWRRRLPNARAVESFLGLDVMDSDPVLAGEWQRAYPRYGFINWHRRLAHAIPEDQCTYKLYVAARIADMRDILRFTAEFLHKSSAISFKVGGSLRQLLRPDKMVVYFKSFEGVTALANCLLQDVRFERGTGVPFAADLDAAGRISWGIDPPRRGILASQEQSWRSYLCREVASALIIAKVLGSPNLAPWEFAFRRICLDAIDPTSWRPTIDAARSDTPFVRVSLG